MNSYKEKPSEREEHMNIRSTVVGVDRRERQKNELLAIETPINWNYIVRVRVEIRQ